MTTVTIESTSGFDAIKTFIVEAVSHAVNKVTDFLKGTWEHLESVTILVFASLGLNALLGEIPFHLALPMWIESPMVIPVLSVLGIALLLRLAEHRRNKRAERAS